MPMSPITGGHSAHHQLPPATQSAGQPPVPVREPPPQQSKPVEAKPHDGRGATVNVKA